MISLRELPMIYEIFMGCPMIYWIFMGILWELRTLGGDSTVIQRGIVGISDVIMIPWDFDGILTGDLMVIYGDLMVINGD